MMMSAAILEQVLELVEQLTPEELAILELRLQQEDEPDVTREMLIAEHQRLKERGAFEHVRSLGNAFANPKVDLTDEDLNEYLRQVGKEWEAELDELNDNP
jgi:hypothetical protein